MTIYLYGRLDPGKLGGVSIQTKLQMYADMLAADKNFVFEFGTGAAATPCADDYSQRPGGHDRDNLAKLLKKLNKGDTVIVYYLSHISTEFPIMCGQLLGIIKKVLAKQGRFIAWWANIDTNEYTKYLSDDGKTSNLDVLQNDLDSFKHITPRSSYLKVVRTGRGKMHILQGDDGADGGGNGGM